MQRQTRLLRHLTIARQSYRYLLTGGSDKHDIKSDDTGVVSMTALLIAELSLLGAQGANGRLARAEQALDALLDAQLRSRQHDPQQDGCFDSDGSPADLQDDYIDSDAADTDSDDSLQAAEPLQIAARQQTGLGVKAGASNHYKAEQPAWKSVTDDSNPPSFSQVDLSRPDKEIRSRFPMFPVGASAVVISQSPFLHVSVASFAALELVSLQQPSGGTTLVSNLASAACLLLYCNGFDGDPSRMKAT